MSAHELFRLDLPDDKPTTGDVVLQFPTPTGMGVPTEAPSSPEAKPTLVERLRPAVQRSAAGWRTAWVGDGLLGMRPRPVADLARQYWTEPKPYIADAWILRIPYALYGVPVIAVSAAAHLLLLIISYPSLLAASGLLALFVSLFL